MSDFPHGGNVETTKAWLDRKGFRDVFLGWEADALLGKTDEYVASKFRPEDRERADMLSGYLNTARQMSG